MWTKTLVLACAVVSNASPILFSRQANSDDLSVTDATWDGQCFYPKPDDDFDLEHYLGRWYQVAGTPAPFTSGCKCVQANYALNENGTVNVLNTCQASGRTIDVEGTATPVDQAYGENGVFSVQFPGQPGPECRGPNYIVQKFKNPGDDDDNNDDDNNDDDNNDEDSNDEDNNDEDNNDEDNNDEDNNDEDNNDEDNNDEENNDEDNDDSDSDAQDVDDGNGWAIVQASNFTTLFLLSREQNPPSADIDRWLAKAEELGSNLTNVIYFDQSGCS